MGAGGGPLGLRTAALSAALVASLFLGACSPVYLLRAGWAEARILAARRPIAEILLDPETDARTRDKLAYVWEARHFAADSLGLRVGDAYTTYTRLERDTLALVLSAAPADRLAPRTWWFPVVGRLPYRAYFDEEEAQQQQRALERDGFDTYLRPTAAFSTLGWFSDPLLSTVVRAETGSVVETVFHEMAHTHLFVPGRVRFNESFANFVGSTGAIAFFCGREGGGPKSLKCLRAQGRWADDQRFSRFLDEVVADLQAVYADPELARDEKLARKEAIFEAARERFVEGVRPLLQERSFAFFTDVPLNNATLLARMRYYHRLTDFQALLESEGGSVARAVRRLEEGTDRVDDPFELLPRTRARATPPGPGRVLRRSRHDAGHREGSTAGARDRAPASVVPATSLSYVRRPLKDSSGPRAGVLRVRDKEEPVRRCPSIVDWAPTPYRAATPLRPLGWGGTGPSSALALLDVAHGYAFGAPP